MLALVGCPFGPFGSDPRQVQSCRLTGAFTRHDPPDSLTDRWIQVQGLGDIDSEDAAKWRRKLQDDEQLEEFGERVIGIVDRVESATKAKLVGLMLREYLNGRCDRETYLRSIEMIDRALTEDLSFLVNHRTEDLSDPACARLMAVGLMTDRSSRFLLESSMPPAPRAPEKSSVSRSAGM